ncbi:hypothetical protein PPTS312_30430 [Pseudomonas putida]|uniref:Uncharacterized protein n=1 Tax=Pseudomonas putida TaxID=303 RepID=A0A7U6M362_PSEPU|nr:hypothetical protein PPTS312_30430 [Pseudomonas putida]
MPWRLDCRQGLVIDPDFIALDPGFVATQVGQRRGLADHPVVNRKGGFMPRADQQASANHTLVERSPCVGAIALVGPNLVALADEDKFFATGLNAQRTVFVELAKAGHGVLGHGVSPKGPLEPFDAWVGEGMR